MKVGRECKNIQQLPISQDSLLIFNPCVGQKVEWFTKVTIHRMKIKLRVYAIFFGMCHVFCFFVEAIWMCMWLKQWLTVSRWKTSQCFILLRLCRLVRCQIAVRGDLTQGSGIGYIWQPMPPATGLHQSSHVGVVSKAMLSNDRFSIEVFIRPSSSSRCLWFLPSFCTTFPVLSVKGGSGQVKQAWLSTTNRDSWFVFVQVNQAINTSRVLGSWLLREG